jgi:hypothetical protein
MVSPKAGLSLANLSLGPLWRELPVRSSEYHEESDSKVWQPIRKPLRHPKGWGYLTIVHFDPICLETMLLGGDGEEG